MLFALYRQWGNGLLLISDITRQKPELDGKQSCVLLSGKNLSLFDDYHSRNEKRLKEAGLIIVEDQIPASLWYG